MFNFINKIVEHYCTNCRTTTEMKIVRLASNLNIYWLKCKECHNNMMIKKEELERKEVIFNSGKSRYQKIENRNKNETKEYHPTKKYKIGDKLYHSGLKDTGVVTKLMPGSEDYEKINVKFKKCGEKKLIHRASKNKFKGKVK